MKRAILIMLAAVAVIFLFLLALASASTSRFAGHYPLLIVINTLVVIGLLGIVGWQVRVLYREYADRIFGSRLKFRLMMMFGALAVLPGLVVYAVSIQFVTRSIDTWFNVRVESALSSGLALGRTALDALLADLRAKGESMANDLNDYDSSAGAIALGRFREQHGVQSAMLFSTSGKVLASAGDASIAARVGQPGPLELEQAVAGKATSVIESDGAGGMSLRVLVGPVPQGTRGAPAVLQLLHPAPAALVKDAEAVQAVYRDYEQLLLARRGLTQIYAATLTLTVLLALSAAFTLAFYFARRLSAPLSLLAEGTQAVAQGDFSPRQAVYSGDELGVLTQSFSRMTRQLADARKDADHHRVDLEASRAFLESILANLSAGVMVFDRSLMLRHYNESTCRILADDLAGLTGASVAAWPRLDVFARAVADGFSSSPGDWQSQVELTREKGEMDGMPQFLLLRGSRLPDAAGEDGYVLVFDDVTRMIASQRSAAWGEVARRLAHEIKNPLTPIQLSAERLQQKLAPKLDEAGVETLNRSVGTIVRQVEAMKRLVNDFRDYARAPLLEPVALDINGLILEILGLYENSPVRILPHLSPGLPAVAGDATRLRQVVHNLVRNAEDALVGVDNPQMEIYSEFAGGKVRLLFLDNGPGFPVEVMARAFEPYVTTKRRGTGLGLAIVRRIIDEHQGKIALGNSEPHGARIVIELPLIDAELAAAA